MVHPCLKPPSIAPRGYWINAKLLGMTYKGPFVIQPISCPISFFGFPISNAHMRTHTPRSSRTTRNHSTSASVPLHKLPFIYAFSFLFTYQIPVYPPRLRPEIVLQRKLP